MPKKQTEAELRAERRKSFKVHAPKRRQWRKAFLSVYRLTGILTAAAEKAGVTSSAVYKTMERDPGFAEQVKVAARESIDVLESVAVTRATQGEKPSDILLMFVLKSRAPERFRDNYRLEHTGPDGAPIAPMTAASGAIILLPRDGFEEAARMYADPTNSAAAGSGPAGNPA